MNTENEKSSLLARDAQRLGAQWMRRRGQQATLALGCSCGAPTLHIALAGLEHDLIAHLERKYAGGSNQAIARVLAAGDEDRSLSAIIAKLAAELLRSQQAQPLLEDLQKSIGSLDPRVLHCVGAR